MVPRADLFHGTSHGPDLLQSPFCYIARVHRGGIRSRPFPVTHHFAREWAHHARYVNVELPTKILTRPARGGMPRQQSPPKRVGIFPRPCFRKNIRNLTKVRIISGQTKQIAENQRGRYMEITLLDIPAEELEQIIGKMLDRKIARGIWFEDDVNVLASNCVLNSAILKEKAPMAPKSNKLERLKSPVLLVFLGIARTIKKVSFPTVKSEKAYEEYKLVCNE